MPRLSALAFSLGAYGFRGSVTATSTLVEYLVIAGGGSGGIQHGGAGGNIPITRTQN